MDNTYKWKTSLGRCECSHLSPGDLMFFVCRAFDTEVTKLQKHIEELVASHTEEVITLQETILDWRIKYLELLEKVTSIPTIPERT